jgi:hypothetical protein
MNDKQHSIQIQNRPTRDTGRWGLTSTYRLVRAPIDLCLSSYVPGPIVL